MAGVGPGLRRDDELLQPARAYSRFHPSQRLLPLVGVDNRGDAIGVGGKRRDAGALDLQ
jgi:hypothetical protein